jgi:hypothetical protein
VKTVAQYIREHMEKSLFPSRMPSLQALRQTEWCDEFERLMRNRLIVGAFRYGLFSDPDKFQFRIVESMRTRLEMYVTDRNLEHLVDIANLALVEFVAAQRRGATLHAIDDGHHVERIG